MTRFALAVCCLFLLLAGAQAGTISFTPPNSPAVGNWGTSSTTIGGIQIQGYQNINGNWVAANLFGRNESGDHGVGICSAADGTNCGTGSGGGDYNELDNAGGAELIRLTLPAGFNWTSVQVSSLDQNSDPDHPANWERGILWGSNNGDPNSGLGTTLCDFVYNNGGISNNSCSVQGNTFEPTLSLSGGKGDTYLFFQATDWLNHTNTNNDYLVEAASITSVPEPASMIMFGTGLAGLISVIRRYKLR